MTTSCPYCGATLNLNFCVVCGRQSGPSMNKMGNLKNVARNTDITTRLEDPLQTEKYRKQQKAQRFRKVLKFILETTIGGLIVAALIFLGITQMIDSHVARGMNQIIPWMKTHRLKFSDYWASESTEDAGKSANKNNNQAKTKSGNKAKLHPNTGKSTHHH